MKQKTFVWLLVCIIIALVISAALWIFTRNHSTEDDTTISWDLFGTFVYDNGTTKEAGLSIDGSIHTLENETLELAIDITPQSDFQYLFNSKDYHFISDNQKHGDLPHLIISLGYTYNKNENKSTMTCFALDLDKEYFIAMFRDTPHCYFVAAEEPISDYNQLLTHFSDFITSYSAKIWNE